MKRKISFLAFIVVSLTLELNAQNISTDPGWQWARLSNIHNSSSNEDFRKDFDNNFLSFYYYADSIIIDDTAFYHAGNYPNGMANCIAIVKRNSKGEFLKAADIYTTPNEYLFSTEMELDKESNVYIYGTFTDTLFVNGHTVLLPNPDHVDVYLLKLDNNFEFQWAQTISYIYQDDCRGIEISEDNYIYLSVEHMAGMNTGHVFANYFNQDSADVYGGLSSLLKIDTDGQIIWRCEIRDPENVDSEIDNTAVGKDGKIYITGNSSGDVYFQGDTIKFPDSTGYYNSNFIVQFDPDGSHHNAFFETYTNFYFLSSSLNIDKNGNYCISGIIQDTLIFGSDTIQVSDDSTYAMIARMDPSFQPIWYQGVKTSNGVYITFQIELIDDSIAFAFHGKSRFTFMGIEYAFNAVGQVFLGLFSPEGDLVNLQLTDASIGATLTNFLVDNCGNSLIEGRLRGFAHFGNETLNAGDGNLSYQAKNSLVDPALISLPQDTANCGPLKLYAPEGYYYYRWNGLLSDQNWFMVNNSGTVNLKVANENCCWSEAEIAVTIWDPVEFSLGNDTTILLTGTLELRSDSGYESYLWSTGDTTSNLIIPANRLQIGNNVIWLEISNNNCIASDTVIVTVIDNSSVYETVKSCLHLIPNPAKNYVQIVSNPDMIPERVVFFNQQGIKVLDIKSERTKIDISLLETGIYVVELFFREEVIRKKLVIN